jgi:hypothetical protein
LAGAAAAAVGISGSAPAQAGLIIDLRATAVNGQPLAGTNTPKQLGGLAPGDFVTLGLFARVSGTNGVSDEGLTSVHGAMISDNSAFFDRMFGNLAGGAIAPFADSGSQNGSVQDLDGDGDLDIGVTPNGGTPTTGYFIARASALQTNGTVIDANTKEFQVGQFTFTVSPGGSDTFINFVRRANAAGGNITTAGVWSVDGVARNPTSDSFGSGTPVAILFVPEPSAAASAAVVALGLLARRRV